MNRTVCELLEESTVPVPNEWYDDDHKKYNELKPDYVNDAIHGIIPEYK